MKKLFVRAFNFLPTADSIGAIIYRIILNIKSDEIVVLSREYLESNKFPEWLLNYEEKIKVDTILFSQLKSKNLFTILKKIVTKIKENIKILKYLFKKPDIILTSIMPENGHWYGYFSKLINRKVKWIAFFSDPYANSPFEGVNKNKIKKLCKYIEEKLVFKYADRIIYVSEAQRDFSYKGKNKESQTIVIPFYYLSRWKKIILHNVKKKNRYSKEIINIIHPGNIYGNRKLDEFFIALKKFENKLHYYNCGIFDEELIRKYNLENLVTSFGHVNYETLLENISDSDYVIVIDSFFENIRNPYMPSKVVDAMYFDKPIIAITDENTELDKFCKITGNLSIRNNSSQIEKELKKVINGEINIKPDYSMYCDLEFDII